MKDLHVRLVALLLILAGLGIAAYKAEVLGLPLTPDATAQVWTVDMRVRLKAHGGPVRVDMPLPGNNTGFTRLQEEFIATAFTAIADGDEENRRAIWTARRARGRQVLYYRLQLTKENTRLARPLSQVPGYPAVPEYGELQGAAVRGLLDSVRAASADIESFARRLVLRYNEPGGDDRVRLLRDGVTTPEGHVRNLIKILAGARIPARVAWTLELSKGMRAQNLAPWLQVHNERRWITIDPVTGATGLPPTRLLWETGKRPTVRAEGAEVIGWGFAATRTQRDVLTLATQRAADLNSLLVSLSLFNLPVQTQSVYRILLMVPVGALIVVLMRNIVGVQTFGTFMPVLIAMAFRETQLILGIVLFCLVVALGLLVRFYLERLRLLLVPRLAAVLVVVVLIMAVISVLSHKLGFDRALSVALFPMVILAMTVERMSLVWEEAGARDALQQGLGSLAVAVLAYLAMNQPLLAHLAFVFPELLLVVLAMALLLGRYTGYRLTELWRFRAALRDWERP